MNMAAMARRISFEERLQRIELQQRAKAAPARADGDVSRHVGQVLLRLVVVAPVWLLLLKAALIVQMGMTGYLARLATIDADGVAGQIARLVMQPDPLSLALTRVIGLFPGF